VSTERRISPLNVAAEVALVGVTLATVLSFSRLFVDESFLPPVMFAALASHGVSIAGRRLGWTIGRTALVSFLGLVLVVTWLHYIDTTAVLLPTRATAEALRVDADAAWDTFESVAAPAPVETGFVIALSIAIWAAAFLADWAAFRLWSPVEAVVPACALFLFGALLGSEDGQLELTAVFLAALIAFELLHHVAKQLTTRHWINADAEQGGRSLVVGGALMGLLAVCTAVLAGPALPGAEEDAVIDWRDVGDDTPARVTVSPMVSIRSELVNQPDVEVFTVESDEKAYWRLTALDTFDGDIWKSSGSFEDVDHALPRVGPEISDETSIRQAFEIKALDSLWLPVAFEPTELDAGSADVVYEAETATLIVSNELPNSDGLTYQATSVDPSLDETLLNRAGAVPDEIASRFLELPSDFAPNLTSLAEDLTQTATTPYEKALALQDFFRTQFTYNDQVDLQHDINSIEQFLELREGYCEQFAGTYAALARSIGLPARVAVGFTWGDQDAENPNLYHVTGRHAHAWPEVWLPAAGWVPFEPTPSRGNPLAEDITGVAAEQALPAAGNNGGSTVPTTSGGPTTTGVPATGLGSPFPNIETNAGAVTDAQSEPGTPILQRLAVPLAVLVVLALVYSAVVLLVGAAVRRRHIDEMLASTGESSSGDHGPAQRARLAWFHACRHLAVAGLRKGAAETPHEFTDRVLACTDLKPEVIGRVASLEVAATYGTRPPTEAQVNAAEESAQQIRAWVRTNTAWWERLRFLLDPRPLLPRRQRVVPSTPLSAANS
jgi:transglutaminase-like putative cysteine protease